MSNNLPSIDYTKLPEPSRAEVEVAIEKLTEKYRRTFNYEDAAKFIKLHKALEMWEKIDADMEASGEITAEDAQLIQQYFKDNGEDISLKRAYLEAEKGLITHIATEMLKITDEIKKLTEDYK